MIYLTSVVSLLLAMMVFPFSLVLMYGRMLKRLRHSIVIFSVMLLLFIGTIVWAIYFDTLKPNPGLTAHPAGQTYNVPSATAPGGKREVTIPAVAGLPVDQHLGNIEVKSSDSELRQALLGGRSPPM
jgi:K+-transporting ATPase ATPase A chain